MKSVPNRYSQQIVETCNQGIWVIDTEGKTTYINPKTADVLGCSIEEALGKSLFDFIDDAWQECAVQLIERGKISIAETIDFCFKRWDGSKFWATVSAHPLFDETGQYTAILVLINDISDRAWNQQLLTRQTAVLEAIASHQPLSNILRQLIETVETLIPNRFASFLFCDPQQNTLGSAQGNRLPRQYLQALEGLEIGPKAGCGGTAAYRKELVVTDDVANDPLWEDFRDLAFKYGLRSAWSYPVLGENGELLGTFCCYSARAGQPTERDLELTQVISRLAALAITQDRVKTERDQKLSLVEAAVDSIGMVEDDCFCYLNQAHATAFGYDSPNELIGGSWQQLYYPDEAARIQQEIFPILEQQGYWRGRATAKRKDGTTFPQELSLTLADQSKMICVGRNISDRAATEFALQESEQRYELAAEGAKVGVWDWNLATDEIFIAPNLKALLGYEDHEIPNWRQLVHPDDLGKVHQAIDDHLTGKCSRLEAEHRMVHKNGRIIWFLARGKLQRNHQGRACRIIGSNTDITARKEAELAQEKRDRYLQSISEIQQKLLTAAELDRFLLQEIVNILGRTAQSSRAYFFVAHNRGNQPLLVSQQAEWCAEGITPEIDNPEWQNFPLASAPLLFEIVSAGEVYANRVRNLPSPEREMFASQEIQSILLLPLFAENELFGIIGFDQCDYERDWETIETNLLSWAANSLAIAQERQASQKALIESENKYRQIFENIAQGIFQVTQDHQYLSANPFLARLYGYDSPEELINTIANTCEQLYVCPERAYQLNELTLQQGIVKNFESQVYRKDGTIIWISETQYPIYNEQGDFLYFEGIVEDIAARKQAEDQLRYQAFHDGLTQLSNRTWFVQRLEQAIHAYQQGMAENGYAVFFIDLNRFKVINDSLGHFVGDQILKQVAARLENRIDSHEFLARFGGDEFALLNPAIAGEQDCRRIAQNLLDSLKEPFFYNGHRYFISASIGIAIGDLSYQTPEELLRDADAAMYEAKAKGQGYNFFQWEMRERVLSCLLLENDLDQAIERGEFQLFYQPLVDLGTSQLYGFEVLLRWFHPQRGAISPGHFIPVAEQSGVINQIDAWVFKQCCRQLRQWQIQFPAAQNLVFSINLSPVELLQPHLAEQIQAVLTQEQISPHCISLELTETAFLDNNSLQVLKQLQALGVKLSIDDFGTGESSLSRLHELPLSTIKVDRAFVQDLKPSSSSEAIIQTIVALADRLGVNTVSEGIETIEQRNTLFNLGCRLGQGYWYSPPVTAKMAADILQTGMQSHLTKQKH